MSDRKRLIGEVAVRHGVLLEEDDPAFLLVTLAELSFRDAQGEFLSAVRQATAEYEQAAARIQEEIGTALGQAVRRTLQDGCSGTTENPVGERRVGRSILPTGIWLVLAAAVLFWSGFLVGRIS
jgi:hypothetical protein